MEGAVGGAADDYLCRGRSGGVGALHFDLPTVQRIVTHRAVGRSELQVAHAVNAAVLDKFAVSDVADDLILRGKRAVLQIDRSLRVLADGDAHAMRLSRPAGLIEPARSVH